MLIILELTITHLIKNFSEYLTKKDVQTLMDAAADIKEEYPKLIAKINSIHDLKDLEDFDKVYFVFHAFLSFRDFPETIITIIKGINNKLKKAKNLDSNFIELETRDFDDQIEQSFELVQFYNIVKKYNIYLEKPLSKSELEFYQASIDQAKKLLIKIKFYCEFLNNNPDKKQNFIENILEYYQELSAQFNEIEQLLRKSIRFVRV